MNADHQKRHRKHRSSVLNGTKENGSAKKSQTGTLAATAASSSVTSEPSEVTKSERGKKKAKPSKKKGKAKMSLLSPFNMEQVQPDAEVLVAHARDILQVDEGGSMSQADSRTVSRVCTCTLKKLILNVNAALCQNIQFSFSLSLFG